MTGFDGNGRALPGVCAPDCCKTFWGHDGGVEDCRCHDQEKS